MRGRKVVLAGTVRGKWLEVQQAFGVPSPSCLQHIQWCSDRAWHCAMPHCGLPNEPSEARLYLGPGESRRPPLPAGCSLVDWLLAWLPACWLDIDLSGLESTAGRTLRAGAKSGSGSINVCTCLFQRELSVVDREKERVMVCVSMCVCLCLNSVCVCVHVCVKVKF